MLACFAVSGLFCMVLGYLLLRSMPPKGAPLRYPALVRGLWKFSVVATIAFGAALLAQHQAEVRQSETEQRVSDLEQQVNELQQAIGDLQNNKEDRR